jgi:hypothetical protein
MAAAGREASFPLRSLGDPYLLLVMQKADAAATRKQSPIPNTGCRTSVAVSWFAGSVIASMTAK